MEKTVRCKPGLKSKVKVSLSLFQGSKMFGTLEAGGNMVYGDLEHILGLAFLTNKLYSGLNPISPQYRHLLEATYCCDIGQTCIGKRCKDDIFPRIELFPLSSCQVIILIARMTFNCSTSYLMSKVSIEITINTSKCYERAKQWNGNSQISSHK